VRIAAEPATVRIDQWLHAVRLTKTRSDAATACKGGHVKINGKDAKPATTIQVGDRIEARSDGAIASSRSVA
jgi:ribosome-associated heat shock protein Hsp15